MSATKKLLNNRYQLCKRLVKNAGQQVWSALDHDNQFPDRVVVKLLAMNPQMQWDQAKLLEREGQILRKLEHPRIPKYRDYFILDHVPGSRFPWFCLVQNQVPGKSLQQLLDEGCRFSEVEVEEVASAVLAILSYLHHFHPPILHRDIKPSNLMRGEDGHIYLIDFGAVQDQAALEGSTFTVVGTYGYVPMEQFGGRAVPASDLYALGMTLIHLLTGVPPADLPQSNGRMQFADSVGIDRALITWIEKLTEPNVDDRFPNVDTALEALGHRSSLSLPLRKRRPTGSKIQLKKSINQLTITILPRGSRGLSWEYSGMALFMTLVNSLKLVNRDPWQLYSDRSLALLVNLLILIFFVVLPVISAYKQTVISTNSTHFTIYYQLFGLTYWKRRKKITKIWIVGEYNSTGKSIVKIHVDNKTFCTTPMAEVEQKWLMQEIADWIGGRWSS